MVLQKAYPWGHLRAPWRDYSWDLLTVVEKAPVLAFWRVAAKDFQI